MHLLTRRPNRIASLISIAAVAGLLRPTYGGPPAIAQNAPAGNAVSSEPLPAGVLYQLGNSVFRAKGRIQSLAFSPDSKYLLGGDDSPGISVWDTESGQTVKRLSTNANPFDLSFTADSTELQCFLGKPYDRGITHAHWGYPNWNPLPEIPMTEAEIAAKRDPSVGHRRKLVQGGARGISVRDLIDDKELLSVAADNRQLFAEFSADEKLLIVKSNDGKWKDNRIEVWDIDADHRLYQWKTGDIAIGYSGVYAGDSVLVGSADRKGLFRWDLRTGKELPFLPHPDYFTRPVFRLSPDEKRVATTSSNAVTVFDLQSSTKLYTLAVRAMPAAIVYSVDSQLLAVASGSEATIFDLRSGQEQKHSSGHGASIVGMEFSRDGNRLASTDSLNTLESRQTLIVWDLKTRQPLTVFPAAEQAQAVSLSGDGRTVVVARQQSVPYLGAVDGGAVRPGPLERIWPQHLAASSRSGAVIAANPNGTITLAPAVFSSVGKAVLGGGYSESDSRPGSDEFRATFRGHAGAVLGIALSADGSVAASVGDDRTLRVWKAGKREPLVVVALPAIPAACVAISDDGALLAAEADHRLSVWKSSGGDALTTIALDDDIAKVLRFAPDAKSLVIGTKGGRLRLCELATSKVVHERPAHSDAVTAVEFSPDGASLYSGGKDGKILHWKAATLDKLGTVDEQLGRVLALAPFTDGKRLAASNLKGAVVVWDIETGKRIHQFQEFSQAQTIAVSPSGTELELLGFFMNGNLCDLDGNTIQGRVPALVSSLMLGRDNVAISPDSLLVAQAYPAGVRIWNATDGKLRHQWFTPVSYEMALSFSRSG